jgi:hypothetical protein
MTLHRLRLKVRGLLLLPPAIAMLMIAADRLTAKRPDWVYGATFEFDVVDARDKHPIKATITRTYCGPLVRESDSVHTFTTSGRAYGKYRGLTRDCGYGGNCCVVKHVPRTLFLLKEDQWVTEGTRFTIESRGYEPFDFVPVDSKGKPLVFNSLNIPVFRIEMRPIGMSDVPVAWSTRPELEFDTDFLSGKLERLTVASRTPLGAGTIPQYPRGSRRARPRRTPHRPPPSSDPPPTSSPP